MPRQLTEAEKHERLVSQRATRRRQATDANKMFQKLVKKEGSHEYYELFATKIDLALYNNEPDKALEATRSFVDENHSFPDCVDHTKLGRVLAKICFCVYMWHDAHLRLATV